MKSLYQCQNAKVLPGKKGYRIVCTKGYSPGDKDFICYHRLERGFPLEYKACQDCPEMDLMGDEVEPDDRGWATIDF